MIDLVTGAFEAVRATLAGRWRAMLLAAALPALLLAVLVLWTMEMLWASIGFTSNQRLVLALSAFAAGALMAFALARLIRLAMAQPGEASPFSLQLEVGDLRLAGVFCAAIALALLLAAIVDAGERAIARAFLAPGSELLERAVLVLAETGIVLAAIYGLGRAALLAPAAALGGPMNVPALWRASEHHAATLLLVAFLVPAAVAGLVLVPILAGIGLVPLPTLDDVAAIEAATLKLRTCALWAVPLAAGGLAAAMLLMAAGLAAAAQAAEANLDGSLRAAGASSG